MESENVTEEEVESTGDEEDIPFIPTEPNSFWKKNAEKIVGESISVVEDTAKQFVVVTGLLQGIYFHAITFSDIKGTGGYSTLIYMAPLILWFLSLIFAVMVLLRNRYMININSTSDSKEKFEEMVNTKYTYIQISGGFLVLSFLALAIAVLHYLDIVPIGTS
ncbi:hypothetical protein MSHOH_1371 [Methanosarcina horonobensis HB-1 = JCM 15518]|uniref:Uncharacterized protein n=1 Tax=Methanosarcina horonobensis HB-1 = JCM 15518 TaxID=1434110 RepID=A0A0E3S8P1_9EURY|nr:hypothetical protein [Methanosarcina horonobensis]AKB77854.1 hypothetical protein MSHOH_1371 [Methanosarcina horonobensis HB-1 = JCM 15518]